MSTKNLYEEALADARRVREVAVRDASHSVMEALTPRIRKLVEDQLLGESSVEGPPRLPPDQDDAAGMAGDSFEDDIAVIQVGAAEDPCDPEPTYGDVSSVDDPLTTPITSPNPAIVQYELSIEGVKALQPLLEAAKSGSSKDVELATYKLAEEIDTLKSLNDDLRATKTFNAKLSRMIEGMENMYDYVQEVITDPALKSNLSEKLETHYQDLERLREDAMKNRNRRQLREADEEMDLDVGGDDAANADATISGDDTTEVSLNIDVPSELVDELVDSLGEIEVELDEEGDEGLDGEDDNLDDADDLDGDDVGDEELDLGGDAGEGEEEETELQLNSRQLSDDTVVEIDENMLRRELRRMRLSEEGYPTPSADGAGVGAEEMDDFGGGSDEGEPFSDLDVEADWPGARNAASTSESTSTRTSNGSTLSEMEEADELEGEETDEATKCESLNKKLKYEARVQAAAKSRGTQLRRDGAKARKNGQHARLKMLENKYRAEQRRYVESVRRAKQIKASLIEAKALQGRSNSGSNADLRKKLAESNLDNVKLQLANKLLQTTIPNKKKLQIVEALDAAKTVREAKLIYGSSTKLVTESGNVQPRRGNPGSASRPTRSGNASTLNEGFEMNRWQRLAGLK